VWGGGGQNLLFSSMVNIFFLTSKETCLGEAFYLVQIQYRGFRESNLQILS
jgi:hypothetical protein